MPTQRGSQIPLPKSWPRHAKSAVLHVISLAQFSITHVRGWAANSIKARARMAADQGRLQQEIALLREELRVLLQATVVEGALLQTETDLQSNLQFLIRTAIQTNKKKAASLVNTSRKERHFLVKPACMAGVLTVFPNFKAL